MLTSKRKEKISAFLDNDIHQDELMSFSLSAEVDDAAQAQRYQLMGEALRGEVGEVSFIDVSHAVREALAAENIGDQLTAGQSLNQASNEQAPAEKTSGDASSDMASPWSLASLFRPVAGMAVAASVAVVIVFSVNQQENGGVNSSLTPLASNTESLPSVQQPVLRQPALQLANENNTTTTVDTNAKLPMVNQRLVNQHLEFATQDTLQGRLPYVRAVSFEAGK